MAGQQVTPYGGWFIYGPNRWGAYAANQDRTSYYCFVSGRSVADVQSKIDKMSEEN